MGLFSKKRHGKMISEDSVGRRFVWRIENFSKYDAGSTLDSENALCFTKIKFHLHLEIGVTGDVGLYLHYKSTGIPKYSYYFLNSQGQVMRQHTAHSIPSNTERCGHWNACYYPDVISFTESDDVLCLKFIFDDDALTVEPQPHQNTVSILWKIPSLFQQMLNPYSSNGIQSENGLLVVRIDVKKHEGTSDASGAFTVDNIKDLVIFIFCRKGNVPPHSIKCMDEHNNLIMNLQRNNENGSHPFIVPKDLIFNAIGMSGALQISIELQSGGNPLNALNSLSGAHQQKQQQQQQHNGEAVRSGRRKGMPGEKNEQYLAMNGDD